MIRETGSIFRTKEYKGCGIRAASYKVEPRGWVPEACFWLHTDDGWRRLWINSFAHCLAAQDLTFPNKIEADVRAFSLARMLIDRTLPEFDRLTPHSGTPRTTYISKMLKLARRPLAVCNILRQYKYRN